MATAIIMPKQGQSVESCIITKWHKQKGEKVSIGDVLFTYETDKATFDEDAKIEGTILDIYFVEGDDVPVLVNVCVIGNDGENTKEFAPGTDSSGDIDKVSLVNDSSPEHKIARTSAHYEESADGDIVRISPRAKNAADKTGVDYRGIGGSGAHGRIIESDINKLLSNNTIITPAAKDDYLASGMRTEGTGLRGRIITADIVSGSNDLTISGQEYETVSFTGIRKLIAKSMQNSLTTTAQLTLNSSFDATGISNYRKTLKESKSELGLSKITLNDLLLFALSRVLLQNKTLNAHCVNEKILLYKNVHLGVAMDTDRGLMVPTIFNANLKSLKQISDEVKQYAEQCKKGTINPDSLKGGTFTVTNLGSLGVESFTPILNPPQTGILGICNISHKAKEVDGNIVIYPAMGLSLTFDHSAVDGAPAARLLKDLKEFLESKGDEKWNTI
jgi:pyruvate dehydrogenase E2 component (dihydrolipoamide acetyltransferase)